MRRRTRNQKPPKLEPHVRGVVLVIVISSIMSVLDTTIVTVALAPLSRDLHTGLDNIQWVVTAYLLALAAVIPTGSWTVQRFGAFRVYMSALALFTVGSALCALATSVSELIVFRAVQGVGGGLLMPTGMTILVGAAGTENLARVMSALGTPMVLAPVLGPTVGGLLLQSVSWNAIFAVNIPVGIVAAVAAMRLLPRDRPDTGSGGPFDWLGLALGGGGIVALVYGLSRTAADGGFASASVLAPVVAGLTLLVLFVLHAGRARFPLLDVHLYRVAAFRTAMVEMFCMNGALFGSMFLLPLYFQEARGLDTIRTGLVLIPQGIGVGIGMNRSAPATNRLGAGLTSLYGVAAVTILTLPLAFLGPRTSYVLIMALTVARGIGVGLATMPPNTAAFAALRPDQVNDASPQVNVIQRIGASLGTAIVAVVLQTQLAANHSGAGHITTAFDHSYFWVVAISFMAFVPAILLWRLESRSRRSAAAGVDVALGEVTP